MASSAVSRSAPVPKRTRAGQPCVPAAQDVGINHDGRARCCERRCWGFWAGVSWRQCFGGPWLTAKRLYAHESESVHGSWLGVRPFALACAQHARVAEERPRGGPVKGGGVMDGWGAATDSICSTIILLRVSKRQEAASSSKQQQAHNKQQQQQQRRGARQRCGRTSRPCLVLALQLSASYLHARGTGCWGRGQGVFLSVWSGAAHGKSLPPSGPKPWQSAAPGFTERAQFLWSTRQSRYSVILLPPSRGGIQRSGEDGYYSRRARHGSVIRCKNNPFLAAK
jgi:hypothetical protein